MSTLWRTIRAVALIGVVVSTGLLAQGRSEAVNGEWRYYTGDLGSKRYSPLAQITAENVKNLRVVWRRTAVDPELKQAFPDAVPSNYLRSTPIVVDGVLYAPNAMGFIEAFDAASGRLGWKQKPFAPTLGEVAGQSTRGVTYWSKGSEARLLLVRGSYLYALNPKTGELIRDFGDKGRTDLRRATRENVPFFSWTGPIVVNDVVVIGGNGGGLAGGGYGDGGFLKEAAPEDIRGFDVRTGKLLWTFNVVPRPGELGNDTWGEESWKAAGNLASWSPLSGDEELGYVYVPLSAPTTSYYGGWRPGDNLYSDSLVAIDVKTGKRVWHFQMVHHDLWEYDTVGFAGARRHHRERQAHQGRDAAEQDRIPVHVRPRHGHAGVAHRGAAGAAVVHPRRAHVADAAVPDQTSAFRPCRPHRGRPDRLHAGTA